MEAVLQYYQSIDTTLKKIMETQRPNIERAAQLVADCVLADRIFHVFGTGGHSNMATIEICHRAGNLVPCNAILDPGLSCEHGATRWSEKIVGYAQQVLRYYRVKPGDLLIQFNAYGLNCVSIDTAMECKRLGVTLVAVTSPALSRSISEDFPGRHPTKQNLCDLADVVIDSFTPFGEAVVSIEGYQYKVSPISTISNIFILNSINAKACELIAAQGMAPPVWISGNVPGGDKANQDSLDRYFGTLRHL